MMMKLADDCFFHDKDRMPHDEALAVLKSRVRPVVGAESIDLRAAPGRQLGEAVRVWAGAVMPDGFDTVVRQEDVGMEEQSGQTWVITPPGLKPGANRRLA